MTAIYIFYDGSKLEVSKTMLFSLAERGKIFPDTTLWYGDTVTTCDRVAGIKFGVAADVTPVVPRKAAEKTKKKKPVKKEVPVIPPLVVPVMADHRLSMIPREASLLIKKNPRFKSAMKDMPGPSAFEQGAIAIRGIIREKKKSHSDFGGELEILYWLAAIWSFYIPNSITLNMPGYNVFSLVPEQLLFRLEYSYSSLGYQYLELLNVSDRKMIASLWGEPYSHGTLHFLHSAVWSHYEVLFKFLEIRSLVKNKLCSPGDVAFYRQNAFLENELQNMLSGSDCNREQKKELRLLMKTFN